MIIYLIGARTRSYGFVKMTDVLLFVGNIAEIIRALSKLNLTIFFAGEAAESLSRSFCTCD